MRTPPALANRLVARGSANITFPLHRQRCPGRRRHSCGVLTRIGRFGTSVGLAELPPGSNGRVRAEQPLRMGPRWHQLDHMAVLVVESPVEAPPDVAPVPHA